MTLKIEMLRGFVAVARSGNLTDAALILKRTPSAVSMMLKQFEAHLGEPLFETDRKNKLTALGAFVLEQSEQQLQHFDNTVRAIESFADASMGHVRIATVPSVAGTIMPRVFSGNIKAYESVRIDLRDMDSKSVLHELTRGRIDIGIATLSTHDTGLHSQPLMTDWFGVMLPPEHPLALTPAPIEWDALAQEHLIANSLSEGILGAEVEALHSRSRFSAHNLTSILGLVRAGIGITILPEMAASSAGHTDLVFRPIADEKAKRHIHLLRRADSAMSPAAQRLEADILETVDSLKKEQQK
ncbi:LysR substrate-binding domain-containing protein [Shimia sp. R9_3]|uniref:LysR family transcriptional regulator n=1 Tax=Shimia sp. R9_3 TaxID=2821113 RepID=UPI001ADD5D94|nr:LysR substrate-binding domain-containing protein [Shimia sp. R9_3]MBO9403387.1 LysR family transcriptional regulator [Shimia sp. R9_3]